MQDLKIDHQRPFILYCDNLSAIQITSNQVFHERTNHIEIDYHLIREKIKQGVIKLLHINTQHQQADILTKALSPAVFHNLMTKLGLLNIYAQLEGVCQSNQLNCQSNQLNCPSNGNNRSMLNGRNQVKTITT